MPAYQSGRKILARLSPGADLVRALTALAGRENVSVGVVAVIGAVRKATIGYYRQDTREYEEHEIAEPMEICSCLGNISSKDGKTFIHAHIVLADREGRAVGGHLAEGTIVFAAECLIEELVGAELERSFDESTGLSLWPPESR